MYLFTNLLHSIWSRKIRKNFENGLEENTLINEYYYWGGSIEYQGMKYYVKYKDKMYFVDHLASHFEETITLKYKIIFFL